jgi:hypothetical protein
MAARKYFSIAKRDGDRVVREYIGALDEPVTVWLYRKEKLTQAEKQAHRKQRDSELAWYKKLDSDITMHREQLQRAADLWAGFFGFGLTKNWKWKNSRTRKIGGRTVPDSMTRDDFDILVSLAEKGDAKALESLKSIIASDRTKWRVFGDLSFHVKFQFLSMMTRGDVIAKETIMARMDELTKELGQGDSSPVRDLAIDQVVLCWLDVHYQRSMAAERGTGKTEEDLVDRRLTRAQKRYAIALELVARLDGIQSKTQET